MKKEKDYPYLRQIFLRMLLYRLYIPLIFLGAIVITGVGYLGVQSFKSHQSQVAESMSHIVDYHLDHGGRILEAVAKVAETSEKTELFVFMKSAWEAYGYFETIYYLDKDNKIDLMTPYVPRYEGIDMSNLPDFQKQGNSKSIIISRPFISLRTGYPTVYLIRHLSQGGAVVGELDLGLFQKEITNVKKTLGEEFVFIMDQTGMILAHPNLDLVKQQENMSNLDIFNSALHGESSDIYSYNGDTVIGSAVRLDRTGWIVVDQISLSGLGEYYIWALAAAFLISLIIWLALVLSLSKQLQRYVISPLEQLTLRTNALTIGDFSETDLSPSIPTSFVELNKLMVDFKLMTNNLQLRETALRESENRHRGLVNRMPVGIFRATINGQILSVNPMLEHVLGYPNSKQLLKVNIINFLYESYIDSGQDEFSTESILNLKDFETKIHCYDGEVRWVQVDSHIVTNLEEQGGVFEGIIQDITERKKTEFKVKEQQELLIKAEREKREVLEKSLIMKDEFISLISHEFKTPLNVIYSAIQLIECVYFNKIPNRVQELIGNIKQNTFRQLRLANNLLDITRINSGEIKLNAKNIDIVFLSKAIVDSVKLYADQKDIKVSFKSNVQSEFISLDEEKYERIILNILSNAMKFTNNGGKITVLLSINKELNLFEIKISDTGIGIPKDKQELIFERFGQVDSNLSRQAEGTGIGLSIVKSLAGILGGTVEVESQEGIGSAFKITLPIKKEEVNNQFEDCLDFNSKLVNEIKVEFSDIYL